jgi:hypothetical protein
MLKGSQQLVSFAAVINRDAQSDLKILLKQPQSFSVFQQARARD